MTVDACVCPRGIVGTTQAPERDHILNVGGFSDAVFEVVAKFASGRLDPGHWVEEIAKIEV